MSLLRFILVTGFCNAFVVTNTLVAASVDYSRHIKPLLKQRCYACHGALKQEAGLRLDTGALLRKGGDSGAAIDSQSPRDSILLDRITSSDADYRMPPDGKPLTREEIQRVQAWITAGATSPATETPESDASEHWAFRRPVRPALPVVSRPDWPRSPVDYFLHSTYEQHKLQPMPDAAPAVQLRRVYLDLIGLPPTPSELEAFLADPTDKRYEDIVDKLLDSP